MTRSLHGLGKGSSAIEDVFVILCLLTIIGAALGSAGAAGPPVRS